LWQGTDLLFNWRLYDGSFGWFSCSPNTAPVLTVNAW
jgi:hypothetical protein